MSLPETYFDYPHRRPGNDHDRFDYSALPDRPAITWPDGAKVALFVTVHFEYYPLDIAPGLIQAPGAFLLGPPNFLQYTTTDYGHRIGAYRLFRVLDAFGIKATAVFNSEVAKRYPRLVEEVISRGWEVAASGTDMSRIITGKMPIEDEQAMIRESIATLRSFSGKPVTGWHSPAHSQSANTYDLLAAEGIEYVMDWINDDMPYAVRTSNGPLYAMPITDQWADVTIIAAQRQLTEEIHRQGIAAYRALHAEADRYGGRILSLPFHPSVTGQPFRIHTLHNLLEDIQRDGGQWSATGSQILGAFRGAEAGA